MKYFAYFLAVFILLSLNLGLFGQIPVFGQVPNLLFLFMVCAALAKKDYDFVFITVLCGLFLDFFSPGFFGGYTFAFLAVAFGTHVIANYFLAVELNFKSLGAAAVLSWLGFNIILWLWQILALRLNLNLNYPGFGTMMSGVIVGLIYNLVLLYPIFLFHELLRRLLDSYEIRRRGVIH